MALKSFIRGINRTTRRQRKRGKKKRREKKRREKKRGGRGRIRS